MKNERPSDLEIAQAICCGDVCRTDTTHCHAGDHFGEAYRVRKLLDRFGLGPIQPPEAVMTNRRAVRIGANDPRPPEATPDQERMTAIPCSDEEQDRIGCEFSTILRSAVVECREVPTSLCCNCRTVIMISALLTGAAHIHHSAGVDEDFAEIARRVYAPLSKKSTRIWIPDHDD